MSTKKTLPTPPADDAVAKTDRSDELDRRAFLQMGTAAGAAASLGLFGSRANAGTSDAGIPRFSVDGLDLEEATIADLQALMESGQLTSRRLTRAYLQRIRFVDEVAGLNSVIETNPDAPEIARKLDRERRQSGPRGPLHGIPILLKDNIDTADQMMTTAGSLALVGDAAPQDATVTAKLREAGAVILGKANLSEWANFRGFG